MVTSINSVVLHKVDVKPGVVMMIYSFYQQESSTVRYFLKCHYYCVLFVIRSPVPSDWAHMNTYYVQAYHAIKAQVNKNLGNLKCNIGIA